jgi:hypothetical protein
MEKNGWGDDKTANVLGAPPRRSAEIIMGSHDSYREITSPDRGK